MSAATLDHPMTSPVVQGSVPDSLPLLKPDSNLSLLINASGFRYGLEAPIIDRPIIEDNKITVRFVVDENVYFDLNLTSQSIDPENKSKPGQFSFSYHIEERRPRAQFVADTLMAVMGLAGRFDLKISEPEVSAHLTFEFPLLEISKMLQRRQTAYRLMVIEAATGKQFLLPSVISEKEVGTIAFVYHAITDRSSVWPSGSYNRSISATQENASQFAQLAQPFSWSAAVKSNKTILGQSINLGYAVVAMEDAVVSNLDEVRKHLEAGDGRQVTFHIRSLSGQDKYEFIKPPSSSRIFWEPKIQALIDLKPYLDAAITERYHALARATLAGLTEEEKKDVTTFPDLDESFIVEPDGA
jgi:hypothetical protein